MTDHEPPDPVELERLRKEAMAEAIARTKRYLAELRAGSKRQGREGV